jgi:hypothetical protein
VFPTRVIAAFEWIASHSTSTTHPRLAEERSGLVNGPKVPFSNRPAKRNVLPDLQSGSTLLYFRKSTMT